MIKMIGVFVFMLLIELLLLMLIYTGDKELKLISQFGIKQAKLLELGKWKSFFIYYRRNEGTITKYGFVCMIENYIINGSGAVILFIMYTTENELFFTNTSVVVILLNGVLLMMTTLRPILNPEQRKKWNEQKIRLLIEKQNKELAKHVEQTQSLEDFEESNSLKSMCVSGEEENYTEYEYDLDNRLHKTVRTESAADGAEDE